MNHRVLIIDDEADQASLNTKALKNSKKDSWEKDEYSAIYEGIRRQFAKLRGKVDPGPADTSKMLPVAYSVAILLIGLSMLLLYVDIVNPIRLGG